MNDGLLVQVLNAKHDLAENLAGLALLHGPHKTTKRQKITLKYFFYCKNHNIKNSKLKWRSKVEPLLA